MAEYDGVHIDDYKVRGDKYVRLWWYTGQGNKRTSKSLGRRNKLTMALINDHRQIQEKALAIQPGRINATSSPTWGAWKVRYLELRTDLSVGSVTLLNQSTNYLTDWLTDNKQGDLTKIDAISRADIARFRQWLGMQSMKPVTVARHIRTLATMFGNRHGALKIDLIPFNPIDRETLNVKTETKGHPDFTEEQIEDLLSAAKDDAWRCLIALCLLAGVRRGEALAMQWSDVSWGEGKLFVVSQKLVGNKPKRRSVRMEPRLESILLVGFEAGLANPCCVSRNNLTRVMETTIMRAGMEPWPDPFHALRRWRDSTWKLTYPEYVVDSWVGHSAEVSREHYLTVPENLYRPDNLLAKELKAIIDDMSEERMLDLKAYLASLSPDASSGS